jgi:hypothetical protein
MPSGGVIASSRVRGGAWSPLDLPSLWAWWDASDADTFTYSSGTLASEWRDKSGNDNHFTAGSGLEPSRSGTQNSLDTLVFDGTNDRMVASGLSITQPLSVAYACNLTGMDRSVIGSRTGGSLQTYGSATNSQKRMFAGVEQIVSSADPRGVNVWGFVFNGSSSKGWKNTTASGTLNPGTGSLAGGVVIGVRDPFTVPTFATAIFEIVITSDAMSDDNYSQLQSYLKAKWDTP